ncbi:dolichyl-phosphate-mannose--protein mannosyltransferase [Nesterenkonia aerolata]|uniref:Polyprenol-phosphate-mannose--protein mannosyltransferase n=1 Tax=Nesterenkonia aerolata TaxID=3074079 RepID=A0ABU2DUG5_9MICC|nr:phospholipid carrier-dependent glycosyltransferase [Nesterenkonia sp. LY-0111]MDR8020152.1 phospholipid carrier-dependent glycosyltransferase [Nesterenkonia sp. LY-0111]
MTSSQILAETGTRDAPDAEAAARRRALQERLHAVPFRPGIWGWLVPIAVTVLAGLLRLRDLGFPHRLIFDETYYAKDAYAMLLAGVELEWPEDADEAFLAGDPQPQMTGDYVVHPPLGKWLIAAGMRLVGEDTAVGWRISAAVAGTLGVLLVALIAQRMFRSVLLGGVAGTLTAVDGHHLVMSRVALLDIFLMVFVLAAFGALLADRYRTRRQLAARAAAVTTTRWGPVVLFRPWLFLAAVLLGAAVAVKLSGLAFLAVFGVMFLCWEAQARRELGVRPWFAASMLRDGVWAAVTVLPLAALTYLASWTGWLRSSMGYGRHWAAENPAEGVASLVPEWLRSLWHYHAMSTEFHQGLASGHDYASTPWTWLFMGRPVSFHYQSFDAGEEGCTVERCSSAILDLANPLLWWAGTAALVTVLLLWIGRRDWRYGAILAGVVGGFAVWLLFPDRTMFFFYTIAYHPFVILAVVAVLGLLLRVGAAPRRNTVLVLGFVLLVVAVSVYFWPLWTGELIDYEHWRERMWLPSWV